MTTSPDNDIRFVRMTKPATKSRDDKPSENVDIWPTLLDMLGLGELPGAEGQSVLPLVLEAAAGNAGDVMEWLAEAR